MRILHVSTRLILGGSQENTVLSCEGQAALGHEVHLAFGPIYGPEGSLLERVLAFRTADARPITTHLVPHLVRPLNPLADAAALRELRELILRLRPDIVHTHSSKAGILGRSAAWRILARARREDRPGFGIVHTIHGPPFMPLEGGPLRRLRTRAINHLYTLAERAAARRCHLIVSVADAMTAQFLQRRIGRPEQYRTVRSGIDTGLYLHAAPGSDRDSVRRGLGVRDDELIVGTVARLAQHKGHDDLLEALAEDLRRRGSSPHADPSRPRLRLLWVGDGWWRRRLTDRARRLGLSVHDLTSGPAPDDAEVLLTGLVPPERVPGLIRAMDILAHPSSREGLPRTVPQALLCGVPVVAYDADGTREICIDAVADPQRATGRLVAVGDRQALRRAVLWLAADAPRRRALAERGRERCAREFSAQAMVLALERVYRDACTMGGGSWHTPTPNEGVAGAPS
jgi:glycosyltransferase involved in cell wall biosynthesis